MRVRSTIEVARRLGVPEWRLGRLIRDGVIPAPPLVAGRRLWTVRHVRDAAAALRAAGLLPPIHDPADLAVERAAELDHEVARAVRP